ncbi:uncharacterized protein FOMMEDRAFT_155264 [Fomitiporia mediterranea MF3/22]|uniref:uncharacterized protein n=1 Tax=Fomitiporia mediterranea (strain MF3/22) TaxID=694068 RepID=UPI000440896A|nr:uncharacterized protein FOMMEDRAFT_155264 [Fomitiporia mediterranea MF3/22]EJD04141.1 hypothetical protein FOMMEDRAFT_155264 [Fomitiporia mediterranea MF3/22]
MPEWNCKCVRKMTSTRADHENFRPVSPNSTGRPVSAQVQLITWLEAYQDWVELLRRPSQLGSRISNSLPVSHIEIRSSFPAILGDCAVQFGLSVIFNIGNDPSAMAHQAPTVRELDVFTVLRRAKLSSSDNVDDATSLSAQMTVGCEQSKV